MPAVSPVSEPAQRLSRKESVSLQGSDKATARTKSTLPQSGLCLSPRFDLVDPPVVVLFVQRGTHDGFAVGADVDEAVDQSGDNQSVFDHLITDTGVAIISFFSAK